MVVLLCDEYRASDNIYSAFSVPPTIKKKKKGLKGLLHGWEYELMLTPRTFKSFLKCCNVPVHVIKHLLLIVVWWNWCVRFFFLNSWYFFVNFSYPFKVEGGDIIMWQLVCCWYFSWHFCSGIQRCLVWQMRALLDCRPSFVVMGCSLDPFLKYISSTAVSACLRNSFAGYEHLPSVLRCEYMKLSFGFVHSV